ncbi:unnamed protein product [Linum trigynum]|uniref:J domain-containing protein n=1 Tax=Linum trigynum TaxID=586398 RepID=A0AAV2D2S4_9ROSI
MEAGGGEEEEHYTVLGLPSGEAAFTLSEKEIRRAYKRKAIELHPDKNPDDEEANRKFQKLQSSYEVLKDEESRRQYDDLLRVRITVSKQEEEEEEEEGSRFTETETPFMYDFFFSGRYDDPDKSCFEEASKEKEGGGRKVEEDWSILTEILDYNYFFGGGADDDDPEASKEGGRKEEDWSEILFMDKELGDGELHNWAAESIL